MNNFRLFKKGVDKIDCLQFFESKRGLISPHKKILLELLMSKKDMLLLPWLIPPANKKEQEELLDTIRELALENGIGRLLLTIGEFCFGLKDGNGQKIEALFELSLKIVSLFDETERKFETAPNVLKVDGNQSH